MKPVTKALGVGTLALVLLLALSFAGRPAGAADPNAEKARAHFQQGDVYFKLDKYPNALQEFEQAYLAKQDPSFLYNIAQCHRLMGNRVEAIRFYKRYITDAPAAANRPVAEKHIRDLESALGAEELAGAHVAPAPGGTAPASAPSGPMPPAATTPTQPALALAAPPPPPPSDAPLAAPPPSSDDDRPIYTKWWFWTAAGGVVAVGLLTALLLSRDPSCPSDRQCQ